MTVVDTLSKLVGAIVPSFRAELYNIVLLGQRSLSLPMLVSLPPFTKTSLTDDIYYYHLLTEILAIRCYTICNGFLLKAVQGSLDSAEGVCFVADVTSIEKTEESVKDFRKMIGAWRPVPLLCIYIHQDCKSCEFDKEKDRLDHHFFGGIERPQQYKSCIADVNATNVSDVEEDWVKFVERVRLTRFHKQTGMGMDLLTKNEVVVEKVPVEKSSVSEEKIKATLTPVVDKTYVDSFTELLTSFGQFWHKSS